MFEEMNQEMEELKQGINRLRKSDYMLQSLSDQLRELESNKIKLEVEVDMEELDVEKLNKKSLTTIFYSILGSMEKQLEKERQEALAARLKLEDNLKQIEDLNFQIAKLRQERKQYQNNEVLYNQLYQKKYEQLKSSGNPYYQNIMELEEGTRNCKASLKEIKEAITAGNRVMDQIKSAESSLNSAEGWGTWDVLGGGLITDMMKHSHIDDARDAVSKIQSLLNSFRTELADVTIHSEIQIQIEGFSKFADFFFDGLIADWVIQSRINDSQESVQRVKSEVSSVLRKLEQMEAAVNTEFNRLNRKLAELIETV